MPRYYFDVFSKETKYRDEVGLDFQNMDEAMTEARRALADMAREELVYPTSNSLQILIRDSDEGPILLTVVIDSKGLNVGNR